MTVKVYDSNYRGQCRQERAEQIDSMSWLGYHYPEHYVLTFHVPNESAGTQAHHALRHKEGVKAGIPDIIHLAGTKKWRSGLFELKRLDRTKSTVSEAQKTILALADEAGSFCAICYGFEQFKVAWLEYMAD